MREASAAGTDARLNRIAALANIAGYDAEATRRYLDGAPHIRHASLRMLYGKLLLQVFDRAKQVRGAPRVLDLGAGEGSVTLPFLQLGAQVRAIDISKSQLELLEQRCKQFARMLEVRCADIHDALADTSVQFDVVVVNSFLHHIPDYLGMIAAATTVLGERGQFFSFQDPLRYDSVGPFTSFFDKLGYLSWRIFRGDVINGLKRRWRRSRGIYLEDSVHDNAEFHVTRNGVDQDAIRKLLSERGFDCAVVAYFSSQNAFFQWLGTLLRLKNQFAIVAHKLPLRAAAEA